MLTLRCNDKDCIRYKEDGTIGERGCNEVEGIVGSAREAVPCKDTQQACEECGSSTECND